MVFKLFFTFLLFLEDQFSTLNEFIKLASSKFSNSQKRAKMAICWLKICSKSAQNHIFSVIFVQIQLRLCFKFQGGGNREVNLWWNLSIPLYVECAFTTHHTHMAGSVTPGQGGENIVGPCSIFGTVGQSVQGSGIIQKEWLFSVANFLMVFMNLAYGVFTLLFLTQGRFPKKIQWWKNT